MDPVFIWLLTSVALLGITKVFIVLEWKWPAFIGLGLSTIATGMTCYHVYLMGKM